MSDLKVGDRVRIKYDLMFSLGLVKSGEQGVVRYIHLTEGVTVQLDEGRVLVFSLFNIEKISSQVYIRVPQLDDWLRRVAR